MALSLRTLACLFLFPLSAAAQSAEDSLAFIPPSRNIPGTVAIYFFPAFPMGDFGDDSGPNAALAKLGIGLGLEYAYPLGNTPFHWISGAVFAINPVDNGKAADMAGDQLPAPGIKADGGTWFNMAFLTGAKIEGRPAPHAAIHVQAQAGLAIVNQADYEFTAPGYSATLASETAFAPGFLAGGGITLFDRLNLDVRIFRTNEASMKGKFRDSDGESADAHGDIAITFLALTVGVQF